MYYTSRLWLRLWYLHVHVWDSEILSLGNDISVHSYHDKSGGEEGRQAEPETIRKQWAQGVFTTLCVPCIVAMECACICKLVSQGNTVAQPSYTFIPRLYSQFSLLENKGCGCIVIILPYVHLQAEGLCGHQRTRDQRNWEIHWRSVRLAGVHVM